MIRTEIAAEFDLFYSPVVAVRTAEDERANALRCAQSDLDAARREYVLRRSHIGKANKMKGIFGKMDRAMAFTMFNKARAALARAEKAMAKLMEG